MGQIADSISSFGLVMSKNRAVSMLTSGFLTFEAAVICFNL